MVRVKVNAGEALADSRSRHTKVESPPDDATPRQLANRKKAQEKKEADLQKTKIKALEKEVKLLVQSIRLKFREHTVEEKITKDRERYSKYGSYVRNVGVPGVYGEGGAEKYSGYKPKGGAKSLGGPERMINGVQVGGLGSAIGAGVAAGGILLLTAAIYKMIANSKIANMVNSSINKALGLILDLILLPFIPLLTWAIINLFKGIMEWNKAYQANPIQTLTETLAGLLTIMKPGGVFELFGLMLGKAIGDAIGQLIIDKIITPTVTAIDNFFPGFKESWDAFWKDPLANLKTEWAAFWKDPLKGLVEAFQNWINGIKRMLGLPTGEESTTITPKGSAGVGANTIADWANRPGTTIGVGKMGASPNSEARLIIDVQGLQDAQLQQQIKNIFDSWIRSHLFTTPGAH